MKKADRSPVVVQGQVSTVREGLPTHPFGDFYVWLLRARWPTVVAILASAYIGINLMFGLLFLAGGDCFGLRDSSAFDAVMFSVQTFATIGYGGMSPTTTWAHGLVATESFVGILFAGMATGLMFARFSKPTARVAFARNALITPRNGRPTLQIRMANERRSEILQASVQVFALVDETSAEGQHLRRFYPLKLERDTSPLFTLSWTVLHPIDEASLLWGLTPETIGDHLVAIAVNVAGVDD